MNTQSEFEPQPHLVGQIAPAFALYDLQGKYHHLSEFLDRLVVLNFWSAECPTVARIYAELLPWLKQLEDRVRLICVAANLNEPADLLRATASQRNIPWVLLDTEQKVADLYHAQTTPHLFVIDQDAIIRYEGAFDNSNFRRRQADEYPLREAVEALLQNRIPPIEHVPAFGCAIVRMKAGE